MNIKKLIEKEFDFKVDKIKKIGKGYDSVAFEINNKYIFKIKYSKNTKKGYEKEKSIYDFINRNIKSNVNIPNIEFSYISDEVSILGYKKINGVFLGPKVYRKMTEVQKDLLKQDIATFLRSLHELDYKDVQQYKIDNKQNVLEEYQLLRSTIYDELSDVEKMYIETFMKRLLSTDVFNGKKCLCHNEFSCNHLILDKNYKLIGVIDFGDAGIIDEYCDFVYLLEDSEEEIGTEFGKQILNIYGNIDIEKAEEYQDIVEHYYPIETLVYGIKNNNKKFIKRGRKEIKNRVKNNLYVNKI